MKPIRVLRVVAVVILAVCLVGGEQIITAAPRQLTLDAVRRRGVLVVGMNAAYAPFEYIENGQFKGFDVDLIRILTTELGVRPQLIDTDWAGVIPALYANKFDVIISAMAITRARSKRVNFSVPYADASISLVVRAGAAFKNPDDLVGKILATQLGSGAESEARTWIDTLKRKGQNVKDLLLFHNMPDAYIALDAGRADAVVDSVPVILVLMKKHPSKYRVLGRIGQASYYGIATRKSDTELEGFFDRQILILKRTGKLEELQRKWFGFTMETPDHAPVFNN